MEARQLFLLINDYIIRCDKVLESQDIQEAAALREELIALDPDIVPIATGIDECAIEGSPMKKADPIKDIEIMRGRMLRHKDKI